MPMSPGHRASTSRLKQVVDLINNFQVTRQHSLEQCNPPSL